MSGKIITPNSGIIGPKTDKVIKITINESKQEIKVTESPYPVLNTINMLLIATNQLVGEIILATMKQVETLKAETPK